MARVVVDIPDMTYESIMKYQSIKEVGADFIRQGTVLPKGHGDLIERKELLSHTKCTYRYDCQSGSSCDKCSDNCIEVRDVKNATTIIEADKEAKNERL